MIIIIKPELILIPMSVLCSGSFVADIMIPGLPHIGPSGSLTYAPQGIRLSPGGHSANVAIDLAQMGLKPVHAVGSIGNDIMGRFMVDQLESKGVTVHAERQDATTAKNVALLVEGEDRRFIAELTANSMLSHGFLNNAINEVSPKLFYQGTLGGLPHIEADLPIILENAHAKDALTFLDVIMPSNGWGYMEDAYRHIDIFHCNTDEGAALTGENDAQDIVGHLLEKGIGAVIISDGEMGLHAGTKALRVSMPAFKVKTVDPTGTGDALCAGVIHSIIRKNVGMPQMRDPVLLVELLLNGQAAGAACATGIGATTNVRADIIDDILVNRELVLSETVVTSP